MKIRVIAEKTEDETELQENLQNFSQHPSFRIRYVPYVPSAIVTIYDKKEILVTTSSIMDLGEAPVLWSNNPSLLALINGFYETMWLTTIEEPT